MRLNPRALLRDVPRLGGGADELPAPGIEAEREA
jgi:hypothetical protein